MLDTHASDAKRYVSIWKTTGDELDRIKCEELAAMSVEERRRQATAVMELGGAWLAANPGFERESGLVEQQRIFSRSWNPRA